MQIARFIVCLEIISFSFAGASDLENLDQGSRNDAPRRITSEASTKIDRFIADYYRTLSRRDIDRILANFDAKVDYLGGERNKEYVRKDLQGYLGRWTQMIFAPEDIAVSVIDDHRFLVRFTLSYTVR